jgi:hypothetical protein
MKYAMRNDWTEAQGEREIVKRKVKCILHLNYGK